MAEETGSVETGNPEAAVDASVSASATPGQPPAATQGAWIDSVSDTDLRGWAENKGLQNGNFENVLNSYHNLEKMMGADRAGRTVTLLDDTSTPEQTDTFYNRLGRPETPDAYSFALGEGADTARLDGLRATAHQLGITDKQFSGLAEADSAYFSHVVEQQGQAEQLAAVDAENALRQEWGAAFDQNIQGVEQYAAQLGMTEAHLVGLRDSMGPVEAMKFVHSLGGKLGEDSVDQGESVTGGMLTPAAAQQQLGELSMNKEYMEAWLNRTHPGHKAAVEKKSTLARQAAGQAP